MKFCSRCGSKLLPGRRFCAQCGNPVGQPAMQGPPAEPQVSRNGLAAPAGPGTAAAGNAPGRAAVGKAVATALAKSLALSAAVLGPGILLLAAGQVLLGTVWLFVGSFAMVAWTYRKPWRLGLVSCLMPPIAAGLCYALQLALFEQTGVHPLLLAGAVLLGAATGWVRAGTHVIYREKGSYFAQRSVGYLAVWAAAFGFTQLLAFAAANVWLVRAGLATGAFSTAMLAMVALILLARRARLVTAGAAAVVLLATVAPPPAAAQGQASAYDLLSDAVARTAPFDGAQFGFSNGRIAWPQPLLREVSADVATATYVIADGGTHYRFVVTLARYAGADSARPTQADLGGYQLFQLQTYKGIAALSGSARAGESSMLVRALVSKENLRISVDADVQMDFSAVESRPDDSLTGHAARIQGGIGAAILVPATMSIGLAAETYIALRPDLAGPPPPPPSRITEDDISTRCYWVVRGVRGPSYCYCGDQPAPGQCEGVPPQETDQPGPDDGITLPTAEDVAFVSAVIALILTAAGVAVSVAQAMAASVAAAVQAGVEVSEEEIQRLTGEAMWETIDGSDGAVTDEPPPSAPDLDGGPLAEGAGHDAGESSPELAGALAGAGMIVEPNTALSGGFWDRVSEIPGVGRELTESATIVRDTMRGIGHEFWETGATIRHAGATTVEALATAADETGKAISEAMRDPRIIGDTLAGTAGDVAQMLGQAATAARDVAVETANAARDLWSDPELRKDWVKGMESDVEGGVKVVVDTVTDPRKVWKGVKTVSGIENFEKSLDPNRPLLKRIGEVGLGVTGLYGTITGVRAGASVLKDGATRLVGRVGGSELAGLSDDATRLAAGASDDLVGASAPRVGSGTGAIPEPPPRTALPGQSADDPIEALREKLRNQPKGPVASVEGQDYADYLQQRTRQPGSTLQPGHADDLAPAEGVLPDTRGYTNAGQKHIQMVADRHGVQIHARPTTPRARELLERGEALPKPETIKNKSINELDVLLGADDKDIAKVGHFAPKHPPPVGTKLPDGRLVDDDLHRKAMERFNQRKDEFANQAAALAKNKTVTVRGGLIIDKKTGKPFTGDIDIFDIRGLHGETLPSAVVAQVEKDLMQGSPNLVSSVQHGAHGSWDRGVLPRSRPADGGAPKFDVAKGIDQKIRLGHAETVMGQDGTQRAGEALVTFAGREATGPGSVPAPTASWWRGGAHNPLVTERLIPSVAEKHGVRISAIPQGYEITGLHGEKLPAAVLNQIRKELDLI